VDGPPRRAISEGDAEALLDAVGPAGIGAMTVGPDGAVRATNQAAVRLLGVRIRPRETLAELGSRLSALRADGTPWTFDGPPGPEGLGPDAHLDGAVMGLRRKGGTVDWLSVTTRPVVSDGGELVALLVLFGGLSGLAPTADALRHPGPADAELAARREQERLEAQQAEVHRFETIGRLAGGVAHDFNNLLGVISNYATFLARSPELPANLAPDVAQISLAAQRGADLTRQLLLFSRREQLRLQRFDVAELIGSLAGLVSRPLAPVVELRASAEAGTEVVADRGQIEQLLLNLLLNARDAVAAARNGEPAPGRGHVELGGQPVTIAAGDPRLGDLAPGRYALLTVADDGPGMAPETVANAFQPFFTTRNRPDASGLGLATVQGIAERAGGRVWIDSKLGAGTTVSVLLPLPASDADG
jgi:two-component system cell cycle sensor histidine kinase/response regulator CckA